MFANLWKKNQNKIKNFEDRTSVGMIDARVFQPNFLLLLLYIFLKRNKKNYPFNVF